MHTKHYIYLFFISSLLISCNNGDNHSVFSANEGINLINDFDEYIPLQGKYLVGNNDTIYNAVLGEFDYLLNKARNINDSNEKLIALAEAEAKLIDSCVYIPYSYGNINYQLTRVVPHTYYAINEIDSYSYKNVLLTDSLIDDSLNLQIKELYKTLYNNENFYDQLIELLEKNNYALKNELKVFFNNEFTSLNPYDNLSYGNSMLLRQVFDSLFEYDVFGNIKCNIASDYSYNHETNELIVNIKDDAYWYKEDEVYDRIDAYDFLYSYRQLFENNKYCKYIDNSYEYSNGYVSFDKVGISVVDDDTIKYKTNNIEGLLHFLTTLESSPVHEDYYNSNFKEKIFSSCYYFKEYNFYNVLLKKNENHYNSNNSYIDSITFNVEYLNDKDTVNKVINDEYSYISFVDDKDLYAEVSKDKALSSYLIDANPNNNVFYSVFNLNRTDYLQTDITIKSNKSDKEHLDTWLAIQNKDFRKAIYHCINKSEFLNTMYHNKKVKNTFTTYDYTYLCESIQYNNKQYEKNMSYGDIIQSFLNYNISDGCNDSYNEDLARYHFDLFKKNNNIEKPIVLDLLYLSYNNNLNHIVNCFKESVENILNGNVIINLIDADTVIKFLYALEDGSYDMLFNFGYRPDDSSVYNNLSAFSIDGSNISLTCL